MKNKVRFKTWYWSKWVYEGDLDLYLTNPDVELYIEEIHGWHHSEEFKNARQKI